MNLAKLTVGISKSFPENVLEEGHSRPVYGCSVHPDGSLVATSDLGGVVRVKILRSSSHSDVCRPVA